MDNHDALQGIIDTLHQEQGLTWPQIAKQAGRSELFIAGVLRKERNLSARSLLLLLGRLGYSMQFEKITSPASSPSVPNRN
jgi:cyanate lyase